MKATTVPVRIEQIKSTFTLVKKLYCCQNLKLEIKIRIVRCYLHYTTITASYYVGENDDLFRTAL